MHRQKKFIFKKFKDHLKSIGPIIAVILLVVVAVILVTVILSFGTNFAMKSLDKAGDIKNISKSDAGNFVYPKKFSDGVVQFNYSPPSNLVTNDIVITKYKIFSNSGESEEVTLNENYTLRSGSNILNLPEFSNLNITDRKVEIELITSDNKYISLKNINNLIVNTTEEGETESCTSGGEGTEIDPIVICNADDLNNIKNDLDAYYILGKDIDLNVSPYNEGEGWTPIGSDWGNYFSGSFDGNNHTIYNLYINLNPEESTYIGLFGCADSATINNLGLRDVNITGYNYVGSLIGQIASGTIYSSYSTGVISGTYNVGGLVGVNGANIFLSYSSSSVSGANNVGGLLGSNSAYISSCYSSSSVSGAYQVGGLIGENGVNISYCYSSGLVYGTGGNIGGLIGYNAVVPITSSFYDTGTSGQSDNDGRGVPKTTVLMKQETTFTGWDFDTIWDITEGSTYPFLR